MNEIEREIKRVQELRRSREIEQMFADYSNSNRIDLGDYLELTKHKINRDFWMLVELLGNKLDRERKKNMANES